MPTWNSVLSFSILTLSLASGIFLSGCASTRPLSKNYTVQSLYGFACKPGEDLRSSEGQVWLKVKSDEISGQFLATIQVKNANSLRLEVANFLGGTEAVILVTPNSYQINHHKEQRVAERKLTQTWGGIPLQWATELFLGKVPCPSLSRDSQLEMTDDHKLKIHLPQQGKNPAQTFVYEFETTQGEPWPRRLHWEQGVDQAETSVDFEFTDPELKTLSPLKWQAQSPQGSVRVRWKERQIQ